MYDHHLLDVRECLFDLHPSCRERFSFNVHGSVHRNNIPIYIQQDATLHSLLYLETAVHISGGTSTHHQERIQLYLQHLVFVTPLLLSAAIAAGSSPLLRQVAVTEVPPETCIAVSRYNKLCNVASCWIYIGIYSFIGILRVL
jgi:hypothetical protein